MSIDRYNIINGIELKAGLYIVSTPIGNLRDITLRALDILTCADIIACEDTRVSLKLLNHYGIKAKLVSYHEHNAHQIGEKILNFIENGKIVALISDAGTPLISDPGYNLVFEARKRDLLVTPIPGANAILAALVGACLQLDEFYFAGFLPSKIKQRQEKLKLLNSKQVTMIFYESPNRLVKSLQDMCDIFGKNRKAAICRELTKKFETYDIASLEELYNKYNNIEHKIGEVVIIIEQDKTEANFIYDETDILNLAKEYENLSLSKMASNIAKITKQQKSDIYKILLKHKI